MSCKSLLYTVYTGNTTLAVDNKLPLGTTIRRFGKNLRQSGDGVEVAGEGYYTIHANVILTPTTAGQVGFDIVEDGNLLTGAQAVETVATAGNLVTLHAQAVIRKKCCDSPSTIQLQLKGQPSTIANTNVIIEKM